MIDTAGFAVQQCYVKCVWHVHCASLITSGDPITLSTASQDDVDNVLNCHTYGYVCIRNSKSKKKVVQPLSTELKTASTTFMTHMHDSIQQCLASVGCQHHWLLTFHPQLRFFSGCV